MIQKLLINELKIKDSQTIKKEFDELLNKNGNIKEINLYIRENIEFADKVLADYLVENMIKKLEENQSNEIDNFFSDDTVEIQNILSKIIDSNFKDLEKKYILSGNKKSEILKYIDKANLNTLVKNTFQKGYALYSSEGSYYPVVDYQILNEDYSKYTSKTMKEYLNIMSDLMLNTTTVEEYLAIDINTLARRALSYENFIIKNPNFVFIDVMKSNYMVCLWKLVSPNIFDGTLDNDFKMTDATRKAYEEILSGNDSITKESVQKILEFEKANNGVFGSYKDMDKFMNFSNSVEEDAKLKLNVK